MKKEKTNAMNEDIVLSQTMIENQIYSIRGIQVMLDSDLAEIYQVETRALNQAIKRNIERFPEDFMFQLTESEWEILSSQIAGSSLRSQNATLKNENLTSQNVILKDLRGRHRKYLPFVFTEQGVAGLSGVLKSKTATQVHVAIMRAFVTLRKLIQNNQLVYARLDNLERKHLETNQKIEQVFRALERKDTFPHQGVFFDGQIFDAYELTSKIIRSAKQTIVLIDNYIDENTITHLAKKNHAVSVLLLTKNTSKQLLLDVQKANAQYGHFGLQTFSRSHDRFLIIDNCEIYHLGASLKDLGKKWFAFSKLDKNSVESILASISLFISSSSIQTS